MEPSRRDNKIELETLQDVRPNSADSSKIISLRPKLSIVPADYVDTQIKILVDPNRGLMTTQAQEKRNQGALNQIPGLEERSWFGGFVCCSSRENSQQDYAKIIRKHLSAKSRVIRDGKSILIDKEQLVPDDILVLSKGDKVNADALLVEVSKEEKHLSVNAFLYTESNDPYQKEKIHSLGDPWERQELILAGTEVVSGGGKALVLAVGEQTAIGLIMKSFESKSLK